MINTENEWHPRLLNKKLIPVTDFLKEEEAIKRLNISNEGKYIEEGIFYGTTIFK